MTGRRIAVAAMAVIVMLIVGAAALHRLLSHDFVLSNHTDSVVTDIELIRYGKTCGRLERLDPDQTVRIPQNGPDEEGWAVAYSDAEGRWIAPGCIYPMWADTDVAFRPEHRINNDTARRTE